MSLDDHLEFRLLKYFVAIAEAGTFTAAAARLHVAQSAVSTQIRTLEEILNVRLFDRLHGNTLTAEGRLLLRYAQSSLKTREHVVQTLQAIHSATLLPLRLGFSFFIQKGLLRSVCDVYKDLLPDCEMILENGDTDELIDRLRKDRLDVAVLTLPVAGNNLEIHILERERLLVCMRSTDPLADYDAVPPSVLNEKICVFSYQRHHNAAYVRLLEMFREIGITPHPCQPTLNLDHVQWMVNEGTCYSLIRASRPLAKGLVTRPIAGVDWTIDTAIVTNAGTDNPALSLFVDELKVHFRQMGGPPEKKPAATVRVREVAKKRSGGPLDPQLALFELHKR